MAKFVIETQGLENYGAHNDTADYWKFKIGERYIITGFEREQDAIAFVLDLIDNSYNDWKYYPSKGSLYDDWVASFDDDEMGNEYLHHCLKYAQRVDANGTVDNRIPDSFKDILERNL